MLVDSVRQSLSPSPPGRIRVEFQGDVTLSLGHREARSRDCDSGNNPVSVERMSRCRPMAEDPSGFQPG